MNYDFSKIQIINSTEYFGLSIDKLLEINNEYGYTKEENKLFDDGKVVFFDNIDELLNEQNDFNNYIDVWNYQIKAVIKTINERLAVVLISR